VLLFEKRKRIKSIHLVFTEEKQDEIIARLEHSSQKSLRHFAEKTRLKISEIRFQVCFVSEKELQSMTVNMLWMCNKCMGSTRDHFKHLLLSGWVLFGIYWPVGLLIVLWVPTQMERFFRSSMYPYFQI
jgi:hypothetical protein